MFTSIHKPTLECRKDNITVSINECKWLSIKNTVCGTKSLIGSYLQSSQQPMYTIHGQTRMSTIFNKEQTIHS